MRFIIIIEPGEKYGPCIDCKHDECCQLREIAAVICHLCGALIGFRQAFCYDADHRQVHFICLAAEVAKQALMLGVKHEEAITPLSPICYDKATAAKLLCIGVSTLDSLIADNEISRIKVGTRVSFLPQHLIDFIKRREVRCKHEDGRNHLRVVS